MYCRRGLRRAALGAFDKHGGLSVIAELRGAVGDKDATLQLLGGR